MKEYKGILQTLEYADYHLQNLRKIKKEIELWSLYLEEQNPYKK